MLYIDSSDTDGKMSYEVVTDASEDIHYEYVWLSDNEVISETEDETTNLESIPDNRKEEENKYLGNVDDVCDKENTENLEKNILAGNNSPLESECNTESESIDRTDAFGAKVTNYKAQANSLSVRGLVKKGTNVSFTGDEDVNTVLNDCEKFVDDVSENKVDSDKISDLKGRNNNNSSSVNLRNILCTKVNCDKSKYEIEGKGSRMSLKHENDKRSRRDECLLKDLKVHNEHIPENRSDINSEESNSKMTLFDVNNEHVRISRINEADSFDDNMSEQTDQTGQLSQSFYQLSARESKVSVNKLKNEVTNNFKCDGPNAVTSVGYCQASVMSNLNVTTGGKNVSPLKFGLIQQEMNETSEQDVDQSGTKQIRKNTMHVDKIFLNTHMKQSFPEKKGKEFDCSTKNMVEDTVKDFPECVNEEKGYKNLIPDTSKEGIVLSEKRLCFGKHHLKKEFWIQKKVLHNLKKGSEEDKVKRGKSLEQGLSSKESNLFQIDKYDSARKEAVDSHTEKIAKNDANKGRGNDGLIDENKEIIIPPKVMFMPTPTTVKLLGKQTKELMRSSVQKKDSRTEEKRKDVLSRPTNEVYSFDDEAKDEHINLNKRTLNCRRKDVPKHCSIGMLQKKRLKACNIQGSIEISDKIDEYCEKGKDKLSDLVKTNADCVDKSRMAILSQDKTCGIEKSDKHLCSENYAINSENVSCKIKVKQLKKKYNKKSSGKVYRTIVGVRKNTKKPCKICGELVSSKFVRCHEHKHGTEGNQKELCKHNRNDKTFAIRKFDCKQILQTDKYMTRKAKGLKNETSKLSEKSSGVNDLPIRRCAKKYQNKTDSYQDIGDKLQVKIDEKSGSITKRNEDLRKTAAGSAFEDDEVTKNQENINSIENTATSISLKNITNNSECSFGKKVKESKRKYYKRNPIKVYHTVNGENKVLKRYPCRHCGELFSMSYVRFHEHKHNIGGQQKVFSRKSRIKEFAETDELAMNQILKTYKGLRKKSKGTKDESKTSSQDSSEMYSFESGSKGKYTNLKKKKINCSTQSSKEKQGYVMLQEKGMSVATDNNKKTNENIGDKFHEKSDVYIKNLSVKDDDSGKTCASSVFIGDEVSKIKEINRDENTTTTENSFNNSECHLSKIAKDSKRKYYRRNPIKVYHTVNGEQKISKRYPCRHCGELFSWSYVRFHEQKHSIGGMQKVFSRQNRIKEFAETTEGIRNKSKFTKIETRSLSKGSTDAYAVIDGTKDKNTQLNLNKINYKREMSLENKDNNMLHTKEFTKETEVNKKESAENIKEKLKSKTAKNNENVKGRTRLKDLEKRNAGSPIENEEVCNGMENIKSQNTAPPNSLVFPVNYKRTNSQKTRNSKRKNYRRNPINMFKTINGVQKISKRYPCKYCGALFSWSYVRLHERKHGIEGQQKVLCRQQRHEEIAKSDDIAKKQVIKRYKCLGRKSKGRKTNKCTLSKSTNRIKDERKSIQTDLKEWNVNDKGELELLMEDIDIKIKPDKGPSVDIISNEKETTENFLEKLQKKNNENRENGIGRPTNFEERNADKDGEASNLNEINSIKSEATPKTSENLIGSGRNVKDLKRKYFRNPIKVYHTIKGVKTICKRYPCRFCGELFSCGYVRFHERKHGTEGGQKVICRRNRVKEKAQSVDFTSKKILKTYSRLRKKSRSTINEKGTTVADGNTDKLNLIEQKVSPVESKKGHGICHPESQYSETYFDIKPEVNIADKRQNTNDETSFVGKDKHKDLMNLTKKCSLVEEQRISLKPNSMTRGDSSKLKNHKDIKYGTLGMEIVESRRKYFKRNPVKILTIVDGVQKFSKRYPCRYCGELFSWSYVSFHEHKHGSRGQQKVICRRKRQAGKEIDELAALNKTLHHIRKTKVSKSGNSERKTMRRKIKLEKIKEEADKNSIFTNHCLKPIQTGYNEKHKLEKEDFVSEETGHMNTLEGEAKSECEEESKHVKKQEKDINSEVVVDGLNERCTYICPKEKLDCTISEICSTKIETKEYYQQNESTQILADTFGMALSTDVMEKVDHTYKPQVNCYESYVTGSIENNLTEENEVYKSTKEARVSRQCLKTSAEENNSDHEILDDMEDTICESSLRVPVYPLVKKLSLKEGETVYSPVDNAIEVFQKEANIKEKYRKVRVLNIDADGCLEKLEEGENIEEAQSNPNDDEFDMNKRVMFLNRNKKAVANEAVDLSVKKVDTGRDFRGSNKSISVKFEIQIDLDGISKALISPQSTFTDNNVSSTSSISTSKSANARITVKSVNMVGNDITENMDCNNNNVMHGQDCTSSCKQEESNGQTKERSEMVEKDDNDDEEIDHERVVLDTYNDNFALPDIEDEDIFYASKLQPIPNCIDKACETIKGDVDLNENTIDETEESSMGDTGENVENSSGKQGKLYKSRGAGNRGDSNRKENGKNDSLGETSGGRDNDDEDGRGNRDFNNNKGNKDENRNVELFVCLVCQETFKNKTELLRHLTKIHRLTNLCQICYFDEGEIRRFANPVSLRNHKLRDHPEDMVKCVCGAMLIDNKMLSSHLKKFKCNIYDTVGETKEMVKCICGKRFASQEFLFNHRSKCRKRHCLDDTFLEYMSTGQQGKKRCLTTSTSENLRNNNENSVMTLRPKVVKDNTSMSEDSDTSLRRSSKGRKCKENIVTYNEHLYDKYFETAVKSSMFKQSKRKSYSQLQGSRRYERLSTDSSRLSALNVGLDLRTKHVRDRNNNVVNSSSDSVQQDINNNVCQEIWSARSSDFNLVRGAENNQAHKEKDANCGKLTFKRHSLTKPLQTEIGMKQKLGAIRGKKLSGQLETVCQFSKCKRTNRMRKLQRPGLKRKFLSKMGRNYKCCKRRKTFQKFFPVVNQWALIRATSLQSNSEKGLKYRCSWCKFVSIHWGTAVRHHYIVHQEKELDFIPLKTVPQKTSTRSTISGKKLDKLKRQNFENAIEQRILETVTENDCGNGKESAAEETQEIETWENDARITEITKKGVTQQNINSVSRKSEESLRQSDFECNIDKDKQNATENRKCRIKSVANGDMEDVSENSIKSTTNYYMESFSNRQNMENVAENDIKSVLYGMENDTDNSLFSVTQSNINSVKISRVNFTEYEIENLLEDSMDNVSGNKKGNVTENNSENVSESKENVIENEENVEDDKESVKERRMENIAGIGVGNVQEILDIVIENDMESMKQKYTYLISPDTACVPDNIFERDTDSNGENHYSDNVKGNNMEMVKKINNDIIIGNVIEVVRENTIESVSENYLEDGQSEKNEIKTVLENEMKVVTVNDLKNVKENYMKSEIDIETDSESNVKEHVYRNETENYTKDKDENIADPNMQRITENEFESIIKSEIESTEYQNMEINTDDYMESVKENRIDIFIKKDVECAIENCMEIDAGESMDKIL